MDYERADQFAKLDSLLRHTKTGTDADQETLNEAMQLLADPVTRAENMVRISQTMADLYTDKHGSVERTSPVLEFPPEITKANLEVIINSDGMVQTQKISLGNFTIGGESYTVERNVYNKTNDGTNNAEGVTYLVRKKNRLVVADFSWDGFNDNDIGRRAARQSHREIEEGLRGEGISNKLSALGEDFLRAVGILKEIYTTRVVGSALWAINHQYRITDADFNPAVIEELLNWRGLYNSKLSRALVLEKILER